MGSGTASQTRRPSSRDRLCGETIADFCEREGLGEPDFSNLTHIDLAYSTTGDGKHEIQVYANFLRNEIVYLVDGSFVDSARFDNTRALAKEGIEDIEFSQFIDDAEAAYEAYQERYKPKPVEKRPLAAGDTVYLENDHPFTVEEIGIFDVHLRDEDFPLIGRAVNRAEFARLLAANPKTMRCRHQNYPIYRTPVRRQRLLRVKS